MIGKWVKLLLVAAPLLAGCGNFWQAPSGGSGNGGCTTNCAAYTIATGTSVATGVQPLGLAEDSTGTYVLAISSLGSPYFDAYTFDATTSGKLDSLLTTTTATGSTAIVAGSGGNFYILNNPSSGSPSISGDSIVSGALTPISGSPYAITGIGVPATMTVAPSGNFLYLATTSGVFVYRISNGVLQTPPTLVTQDLPFAIEVDATNSWLVEATINLSGNVIVSAAPLNSNGLSAGNEHTASFSDPNAAGEPGQLVISQDNNNIFIALGAGGTMIVPFNSSDPFPAGVAEITIPVINSSGSALSVAVDPGTSPRLFYVGETLAVNSGTAGGLRAFGYSSLGSGSLTEATGSPIASGGLAPHFILPVTTPDFVYVANGEGASPPGNITSFSITSSQ